MCSLYPRVDLAKTPQASIQFYNTSEKKIDIYMANCLSQMDFKNLIVILLEHGKCTYHVSNTQDRAGQRLGGPNMHQLGIRCFGAHVGFLQKHHKT